MLGRIIEFRTAQHSLPRQPPEPARLAVTVTASPSDRPPGLRPAGRQLLRCLIRFVGVPVAFEPVPVGSDRELGSSLIGESPVLKHPTSDGTHRAYSRKFDKICPLQLLCNDVRLQKASLTDEADKIHAQLHLAALNQNVGQDISSECAGYLCVKCLIDHSTRTNPHIKFSSFSYVTWS